MEARRRAGSFSPKTSRRLRISKVDMLYGMACLLSASSAACDISTRNGYISSARAPHRHKMATSRAMGLALRATDTGMQSHPDLGLAESRVLARREAHVAGEDELAAHAPDTASDLRDADHRGLGETHERIHQDREARSPDSSHDVPYLASQIKGGKEKLGVRAFEYDDPQARAGVHSHEQIL